MTIIGKARSFHGGLRAGSLDVRKYDWDDLRRSRGPADWEWGQALGAVLLAIGLVGFGIVVGLAI